MLGHAEFDLPRLGDLHHPSPDVCQAAVEGDLEQGLLGKPRKICTEIDMMGMMLPKKSVRLVHVLETPLHNVREAALEIQE